MFKNKNEFKRDFATRIVEKYGRSITQSHPTERYMVLGEMVRDYASINWKHTKDSVAAQQQKQVYYFSMEFLIGRLMTNNLMNLGIYQIVKEGLAEFDIDINEIEEMESDPGLGNGGLGRLAACFLDSMATLEIPGSGNCLRYEYGLFRQKIVDDLQVEVPDQWLKLGNVWEVRKPKHALDVKFWGRIEQITNEDGSFEFHHLDAEYVRAVPYDLPVIGYHTNVTNTLRLWSAEASDKLPNRDFRQYLSELQELCLNVYPDDSTEHGKYLRLKQQYFLVSAGLNSLIKAHLRVYKNLTNFHEKNVIQLNDTHPVLAIPELMRILLDDFHFHWEDAWAIVRQSMAYTNHTVLQEALETWPTAYVQNLLPRIYMIIEEINRRHVLELKKKGHSNSTIDAVSIIKQGRIHMANLAIVGSFSVNGVAYLHTEILKNDVMRSFYYLSPEKFNNKTNGVTHRRWLLYSNPELVTLLRETIGDEFLDDFNQLGALEQYVDDSLVQEKFLATKMQRKQILADYIKTSTGVEVDVRSMFDVQAKRLHAYKRQLLNVLHIIYLYQQIKTNPEFAMEPRTFIFAAKAAPSYFFAKKVIQLINRVAKVINHDPLVSPSMKVVFIPNYSVSIAEILMNAADVSEQISTAGKEASGTGNMKFMMNGAITLGTLDGANVEISEKVGMEYCEIFGLRSHEVEAHYKQGTYDAWKIYHENCDLQQAMNSLIDGTFHENHNEFKAIFDEVMYRNDEYFLLADFESYVQAQKNIELRYQDKGNWAKMCLMNIARSYYFSSDRTIKEYVDDIWHCESVNII